MPLGKRRSLLIQAFEAVLDKIGYRVAPFDAAAAQQAGDLMASRQKKGRPGELRDTMIAGIVLAHHATLATGKTTMRTEEAQLGTPRGAAFRGRRGVVLIRRGGILRKRTT